MTMTGAETRLARRQLQPDVFTRREADDIIMSTTDTNLIKRFYSHKNRHVQRHAKHRVEKLEAPPNLTPKVELFARRAEEFATSEFDLLVARFKAEGKANPERSAKASLSAKAGAKKRAEAKQNLVSFE